MNLALPLVLMLAAGSPKTCYRGGCSGEVCSAKPDVVSTCEAKAEYACYKSARCEPQKDGKCGFTLTPEIKTCLERAAKN